MVLDLVKLIVFHYIRVSVIICDVGFVCLLHFSTAIESISFNPLELTEFMLRVLCGFRSLFGVRSFLILLNFHVESPPLFLLPLFLLPLFLSLSLSFEHAL